MINSIITGYGYACLAAALIVVAYVIVKIRQENRRGIKIGKDWERKMRHRTHHAAEPRDMVTEFDYNYEWN